MPCPDGNALEAFYSRNRNITVTIIKAANASFPGALGLNEDILGCKSLDMTWDTRGSDVNEVPR